MFPEHTCNAAKREDKRNCIEMVNPILSAPPPRCHDVPLVPVHGGRAYLGEAFARQVGGPALASSSAVAWARGPR